MTKRKEINSKPAGKNNELNVAYTQFAANKEKDEIRIGEGFEFENDLLLKSFGFELDNSGTLTMKAPDNDKIHIEEKTNKIERIVDGKVASVAKASKAKIERMIERENAKEMNVSNNDKMNIEENANNAPTATKTRRKANAVKGSDEGR